MPSNSINNDHGKPFTGALATIENVGPPSMGASSSNGVYTLIPALVVTLSDTSLLSSTTMGQPSGIILSGSVVNVTQKIKERFNYHLPVLAVVGNTVLLSGAATMANLGLTNGSSGDQLKMRFNYTLPGAYTSLVNSMTLLLS
tara:strand:- start:1067 stop:1495 length:429 start_codon:yes stop_codon:yes gene_type:complete